MGARTMVVGVAVAVAMLGVTARAQAAFDVTPSGCHSRPEAFDAAQSGDAAVVAVYGYDNANSTTVTVGLGSDNIVLQPPNFRSGQPTEFSPGLHQPAWDTFYDPTQQPEIAWILQGAEATSTPICGGGSAAASSISPPTLGAGASSAAVGDALGVRAGSFDGWTALTYTVVERCDAADTCMALTTLGNTATSYTVAAADAGWSLRVRSVALTMNGWASALSAPVTIAGTAVGGTPSAPTADASADQPEPLRQPVVAATGGPGAGTTATGGPAPGTTAGPTAAGVGLPLTADLGTWAGSPAPQLTVQWQRCAASGCADIPGADATTYTPVAADAGDALRAVVTATAGGLTDTSGGGSTVAETAASSPTAPVTPGPDVRSGPRIIGAADIGARLTLTDPGSFDEAVSTAVQWQACDAGACHDLSGAIDTSYVLTAADAGSRVRAQVTASAPDGRAVVESNALGPAGSVRAGAAPQLSGRPAAGTLIWTDGGSWVGTPAPSLAFQWLRCDGLGAACAAIAGATGPGFRPASADVGHTLRVAVTASNGFSSATATSSPTALVAGADGTPAPPAGTSSDARRPRLARLHAWPRRFRVGRRVGTLAPVTATHPRAHAGTIIALRLSEPSWLRVDVDRVADGRRATVATLTRTLPAGRRRLRFSGRLPARLGGALRPGRYELVVRAFNAAGRRTRRHFVRVTVLRSRTPHATEQRRSA